MAAAEPEIVAPGILRLPLRTPTLPPATHTNCLLVGERRVVVIEPATPHAPEQRRLDAEIDRVVRTGGSVVAILVTHHHPDHVGYAAALRDRLGVPLCAHSETAARLSFAVDRRIEDGALIELDGGMAVEAIFTPGHAPGHLVFRERRSGIAHAGDLVAGEGTVLIDPGDGGDMAAYLASLDRVGALGLRALVPAHGAVQRDPAALLRHYVAHRLMREHKVLGAIGAGGATEGEILARAYDDTPVALWPLAIRSMAAHLAKLAREGRVEQRGDQWRPAAVRTTS